jgi:hypothetical protein
VALLILDAQNAAARLIGTGQIRTIRAAEPRPLAAPAQLV